MGLRKKREVVVHGRRWGGLRLDLDVWLWANQNVTHHDVEGVLVIWRIKQGLFGTLKSKIEAVWDGTLCLVRTLASVQCMRVTKRTKTWSRFFFLPKKKKMVKVLMTGWVTTYNHMPQVVGSSTQFKIVSDFSMWYEHG